MKQPEVFALRRCYSCGKVGLPPGRCYLNKPTDLKLCKDCYHRLFQQMYYPISQKARDDGKRMTIGGRTMRFKECVKVGVCNHCRHVVPFDCKNTQLHHDRNQYDLSNPLRYTIELCLSCHNRETFALKREAVMSKFTT